MSNYSQDAKKAYGTKCEWFGCGWDQGTTDAHHIDYHRHQEMEDQLRLLHKFNQKEEFDRLQVKATAAGYGLYQFGARQLPKNDRIENLAVLCPNHHRFLHTLDLRMDVLKYIPERKTTT